MEIGKDAQAIQAIDALVAGMDEYSHTTEAWSLDLRLDLATIILHQLKKLGWTRTKLAEMAGTHPAMITNIIQAERNWNVDTAARLLHALGVKANVVDLAKYESDRAETHRKTALSGAAIETYKRG